MLYTTVDTRAKNTARDVIIFFRIGTSCFFFLKKSLKSAPTPYWNFVFLGLFYSFKNRVNRGSRCGCSSDTADNHCSK